MLKRLIIAAVAAVFGTTSALVALPAQAVETDQYTTPGHHLVNDRYWKTECEKYSDTVVRCSTDIFATKISQVDGQYVAHKGWAFNNLTYLPSTRAQWDGNPLARTGSWTAEDGRKWKTECDTDATGNGCRSYIWTSVVTESGNGFATQNQWQLNNILQFASTAADAVTAIPAAAPKLAGVPTEEPAAAPKLAGVPTEEPAVSNAPWDSCKASYYWQGQRTANGEYFNPNALTTAHKTLRFGTKVRVKNPANGKSVVVRVNDRGPFISGRCLDLSRAAMQQIGGTAAGVITVQYQVIG